MAKNLNSVAAPILPSLPEVKKQKAPTNPFNGPNHGLAEAASAAQARQREALGNVGYNQSHLGAPDSYDDSDLRRARELNYQFGHRGSAGSEMDALAARSAQRRGLDSAIGGIDDELAATRGDLTSAANQSLESGVRNTRKNYSDRGLLYGGLREGGEQNLRGQVASSLASSVSSANKEAANLKTSYQAAKASLGLKSAQESLARANQVFDMATRNQVARLQAMQALGKGAGYLGGALMKSHAQGDDPAHAYNPRLQTEQPAYGNGLYATDEEP